MSAPPEKQPDRQRIVARLAAESRMPVDDVATLYEQERAKLAIGAHITKFLDILAIRKVQEILSKRGLERPALPADSRPLLVA